MNSAAVLNKWEAPVNVDSLQETKRNPNPQVSDVNVSAEEEKEVRRGRGIDKGLKVLKFEGKQKLIGIRGEDERA
jgi:hypothetical protein